MLHDHSFGRAIHSWQSGLAMGQARLPFSDFAPRLAPLDQPAPSNLVAMPRDHTASFDEDVLMAVIKAFIAGDDSELELNYHGQLPAPGRDYAACLLGVRLVLEDHPIDLLFARGVVADRDYDNVTTAGSDAIICMNTDWLDGDLNEEELDGIYSVLFVM